MRGWHRSRAPPLPRARHLRVDARRSAGWTGPWTVFPSPLGAKFASNPQVSGRDGGQNLNLHQFARDGVVLLGHLKSATDGTNQARPWYRRRAWPSADAEFEATLVSADRSARRQLWARRPNEEELPLLRDGFAAEEIAELNLAASGIKSIV